MLTLFFELYKKCIISYKNILLESFVLPIALMIISILWIVYPPKNRNYIYGYRTSTSLKNNENWHYANFIASRTLLTLSIVIILIHTTAFIMAIDATNSLINLLMISYIIISFAVIPITEISLHVHLKFKK